MGKVLTTEHAKAIITLNRELPLQDLDQIVPYSHARKILLMDLPRLLHLSVRAGWHVPTRVARPKYASSLDSLLLISFWSIIAHELAV